MFTIRRDPENPLISPNHAHTWEAIATFNPSVIRTARGYELFYRAVAKPDPLVAPHHEQSTIGRAISKDGLHFEEREQVISPKETWDAYGCEDPRATVFEGATYVTYTALGGYPFGADNIKVAIAISRDGVTFSERHLATPFNAKALAIFPERVGGKVAALLTLHTDQPPASICVVLADAIEDFWSPEFWAEWYRDWQQSELKIRRSGDDHIEVGSPPILTENGWLCFYSYIEHYFGGGPRVFTVSAVLLDRDDPRKVVGLSYPLLVPEESYEQFGTVPNIVFPTSALIEGDRILLYYGAADTTCARAEIRTTNLLRALSPTDPARTFTRGKDNPIIEPRGDGFESRAVFNAAAVDLGGSVHILYRAMDVHNTSTIGYARSEDGFTIAERLDTPIYVPRSDFEQKRGSPEGNSGCEDPRIVQIDDKLIMTYTAYDGVHSPRGAATTISVDDFLAKRFDTWSAPTLITPDGVDDKDVALLPERVNGSYVLYHRISSRICADIVPDASFKQPVTRCIEIMGPREGMWDGAKVGIAGPPLKVPGGWLMIYHGVSAKAHYRLGAALLDQSGLVVLARTADPIFRATEAYEEQGEIPHVVFSCGAVIRDDTVFLYYGGGDRVTGVATASLQYMLDALS